VPYVRIASERDDADKGQGRRAVLDRVVVQPDPVVGFGLGADTMTAAADAESLDELFLRLERSDCRVDRARTGSDLTARCASTTRQWLLLSR
jgi:hypothetical protein